MGSILHHCHNRESIGHFGVTKTVAKVLQSGFYWPSLFKDAHKSNGNEYILVVVDYVSKQVKAATKPTNDARIIMKFLKKKHIYKVWDT